jgi:hypothetical protein
VKEFLPIIYEALGIMDLKSRWDISKQVFYMSQKAAGLFAHGLPQCGAGQGTPTLDNTVCIIFQSGVGRIQVQFETNVSNDK